MSIYAHMKLSFRSFVEDASPASGSPSAPDNPKTTNRYHFDAMKQQLGIDDDDFKAVLESEPIQIWQVPDYSSKWGFMVTGPVSAIIKRRSDGNYDLTFQLSEKKLLRPRDFILPYEKGERPVRFEGRIEDKTETVTARELQDMLAAPLAQGGAAMPGGPMGGGGMPPMGGPPAPMGAAPPLGGPPGGM